MFQFLRRMILPIILIALIGFLATIVFQWGMDITSRRDFVSANTAAVINGENITWQDFNRVYDRLYQGEAMNSDEDLSDFRKQELRTIAWQQLLHDRLLMQEVSKYNITASDEELYAYLRFSPPPDLQQMAVFQTDGVFDYQKYLGAMADPAAASFWASVEPIVRQEIVKQKLQEMVIQTAQVSDGEIWELFWAESEKVKVGMVNVPFGRFSPPEPTEEELRAYFQGHAEDYNVEARAAANLVLLAKEPQQYDWEVDSSKAVQIYDSLMGGADFTELAQYYSDDVSSQSGGDLGWFSQGQMVAPFDEKVFSMEPGEVSEPVKTQFGWHIIKLHEFRDGTGAQNTREAHASHILFRVTTSAETLDRINSQLQDFRVAAGEYGFEKAAEDAELEVLSTTPFTEESAIDHLGYDPAAGEFAFSNEPGALSPVLENRRHMYVMELTQRLPAGMANFAEVTDQVKADHATFVKKGMCRDTATAIHTDILAGADITDAARNHGAKYETPDEFTRNTYIRGLGVAPEAVGVAFSLKDSGKISAPVDYARGSVILQLLERTPPDTTVFIAQRDSLRQATLATKQQQLYGFWFDNLVENSEIVNNIEAAFEETAY
ncbi:MAG: peptidylprolyl isomerase [Candidatus Zixiibacteriota bacterium]|nr:MAG: peptidylprolyl isomerase [candidate division Zixibacteria bacterium]